MPGWAEVDERRGRLYVLSWSSMGPGSSRVNGWVRSAEGSITPRNLGGLVRAALARSEVNVPMVNFRDPQHDLLAPLLADAGVKSWDGYARSMRACFVDFDDDHPGFLIRPTRNESKVGLVDLVDSQFQLDAAIDDAELGSGVLDGVNRSIGRPPNVWQAKT
jgi:hypothetical protein